MAVEKVIGVAVLSGKGGVGKSVIALNLALALGKSGLKTVLFDAGGGDLNHLTNSGKHSGETDEGFTNLNENVALFNSMILDPYSILTEEQIELFLSEIVRASVGYECIVFDSLSGAGPVSYTLAGLAEHSLLVATPEPTAIAGAYAMIKALHQDGLSDRAELLLNMVESADEAASLGTRFDILTERFINKKFQHSGFIHRDSQVAESVIEQHPLVRSGNTCQASTDFAFIAEKLVKPAGFHLETPFLKS